MKKVKVTKRQLGVYVRSLLLRESSMASALVKAGGAAGFRGAQRDTGGIIIKDTDLKLALLSMISRGDIGLMGNVFEDIAMVSSLPSLHNQTGYENLNDTLAMLNSPAADLGLGFGGSVTMTSSSDGGKIYKVSGDSWSVKSTAAASKSGFSTKATALGQLAACGLHSGNKITVSNLDSQSECYQQMASFLGPGDEVHFNMGLCYYKYDRDDSQIQTLTGTQMDQVGLGNAQNMFSLSSSALLPAVLNKAAILNELVPQDYYVANPTGIYNMPNKEATRRSGEAQRIITNARNRLKNATQPAKKAQIQALIDDTIANDVGVPSGKASRVRDANGDNDFYSYVVDINNPSDPMYMKGFKSAIGGVIIGRMTKILGDFVFNPSGNTSQRNDIISRLINEVPELQSNESGPIPIGMIKDIIVTIEGSLDTFFTNAINDISPAAGRRDLHEEFENIAQNQSITNNVATCVDAFLEAAIAHQRTTNSDYISIHRIRPTAVDIDNLTKPAFKMIYAKSADNLFKLKLLSKHPSNPKARFKLTIPSGGATTITLLNSEVKASTGTAEPVSGTTGWANIPTIQVAEGIKLFENANDSTGLDLESIISTSVTEYDVMAARQEAMFGTLANITTPTVSASNPDASVGANIGASGFQQGSVSTPTKQELEFDIVKNTIFFIKDGKLLTAKQAHRVLDEISSAMEDTAGQSSRIQFPGTKQSNEEYTFYLLAQILQYRTLVGRLEEQNIVANMSLSVSGQIRQLHSKAVMYVHDALKEAYGAISSTTIPVSSEQQLIYNGKIRQFIQASGILQDGVALGVLSQKGKNPPWDESNRQFLFERNLAGEITKIDLNPYVDLGKATLYSVVAAVIANSVGAQTIANAAFKNAKSCGYLLTSLLGEGDNTSTLDYVNKDTTSANQPFPEEELEMVAESRLYEAILTDLMEVSAKKQRAANQPKKIKLTKRSLNRLLRETIERANDSAADKIGRMLSGPEDEMNMGITLASTFVQSDPDSEQTQQIKKVVSRHYDSLVKQYRYHNNELETKYSPAIKAELRKDTNAFGYEGHAGSSSATIAYMALEDFDEKAAVHEEELEKLGTLIQLVVNDVFYE